MQVEANEVSASPAATKVNPAVVPAPSRVCPVSSRGPVTRAPRADSNRPSGTAMPTETRQASIDPGPAVTDPAPVKPVGEKRSGHVSAVQAGGGGGV